MKTPAILLYYLILFSRVFSVNLPLITIWPYFI
nr:MAG TPA: hypothetical protein [Caudoviricetes sp.]